VFQYALAISGEWKSDFAINGIDIQDPKLEAACGLVVSKDEQIFGLSTNEYKLQVSVYNNI
jgi:hypothetical protein